ncbi:ATP-dependent DNA helicase [Bacillus sp. FJAT-42376]|uniref:ATP-dependent DNA helicase n=1 Tax=Bacillus sp. FJAT-42376 TaxID=2014076 RepID=UPI000F4EB960|nr:ATP-dependent DNA helicase [Bacillus sp. FJAT-42376]AZB43287.1 ATP-dependent DNA helicase [Bacillus sp. FJAT-42376]
MTTARLPFPISKEETFYEGLSNWIGDVFYDILPEKGFDLRDEQIFMAFQLERAFKEKKTIFAEAGVGTGKTLVYLLFTIAYARYTGKPAVIACADETLIEQLVKEEGDIRKIAKHLDLTVDARLSKSQDQYLCVKKLEDAVKREDNEKFDQIHEDLPQFVHQPAGLQRYTPYGDRKMYPEVSDGEWKRISWDPFQDCQTCELRQRCGLTLSRDHYRKAADLIICSHDFYMEHVWTADSRKREGHLPFLPEHSSVVFDEGHLLEFAAQKALTFRVRKSTLEASLERLLQNEIREEFANLVEEALMINDDFFSQLEEASVMAPDSERYEIKQSEKLKRKAVQLQSALEQIGEALVFEGELYTIDPFELKIAEETLEQMEYSFQLFNKGNHAVSWTESKDRDLCLVIMPRTVEEVLKEKVFSSDKPVIFSSATLSSGKSFDYMASSLGISDFLSFSVDSPFDYEEQMNLALYNGISNEEKAEKIKSSIVKNEGKSLILFPTVKEMQWFRQHIGEESFHFPVYYEGDNEISETVSKFQRETHSVLCTVNLWEGLDVPGESLSHLIIWALPYPPSDPVFNSKRNHSPDPYKQVDLPYMILRLRQGLGRLIRSGNDTGTAEIFINEGQSEETLEAIQDVLPTAPSHKE